jgi:hypothetical protein
MNPYLSIFIILIIGFVIYFSIKDRLFENSIALDGFNIPAQSHPAQAQLIQSPSANYPERVVASSGPNPPSQSAPQNQVIIHGEPAPTDPYSESQDTSDIPERLRHPERSYRSTPLNTNSSMAVDGGLSGTTHQVSSDNSQTFENDFVQSGTEFMPGIFANDTYSDTNFSTF